MADITKRTAARAARLLEEGEPVLAAILAEPRGTYGLAGLTSLTLLPRFGRRRLERAADRDRAEEGGMAARFPTGSMVLAVTDRRVVAIDSNGVQMRSIVAAFDHFELAVADDQGHGLGRRLTLACADGTGLVVDCQRGQPFDRFAELLAPVERFRPAVGPVGAPDPSGE